jgi:hypothetical protein
MTAIERHLIRGGFLFIYKTNIKTLAVLYVNVLEMWSITAMKKQKSKDGIRGSSSWSLDILCGLSV